MPKEKELIDLVNETCKQLGIKKPPKLFIFDDSRRQLSSGAGAINYYFFSQSALDVLSHDQLKALVAHEMTHHKHMVREITVGSLALGVFVPTMLILASVLSPVIAIPSMIGLLTTLASGVCWYRRGMEREADLGAAEIAGQQAMIDTLRILEKQVDKIHEEKPKKLAKLVPPFLRLYPTIDERVKNIQKHTSQKDVPCKQTEEAMKSGAPKKQIEEVVKYIQNMGSYTVSAMQSGILSDTVNSAREVENTTAKTHFAYKSRDL